jgi:hypothetical protein
VVAEMSCVDTFASACDAYRRSDCAVAPRRFGRVFLGTGARPPRSRYYTYRYLQQIIDCSEIQM